MKDETDMAFSNRKCQVPDQKRRILEAAVDPKKLTESLFNDAFVLQSMANSVKDKKIVFDAKLALKKEVDPVVQRSENVLHVIDWGEVFKNCMISESKKEEESKQ
jgi:hypothetical protein